MKGNIFVFSYLFLGYFISWTKCGLYTFSFCKLQLFKYVYFIWNVVWQWSLSICYCNQTIVNVCKIFTKMDGDFELQD